MGNSNVGRVFLASIVGLLSLFLLLIPSSASEGSTSVQIPYASILVDSSISSGQASQIAVPKAHGQGALAGAGEAAVPLGADCSSPVVFDDHWPDGFRLVCQNNMYVLMVDLTNPAVRVEVVAASSGTRSVSSYADSNTIAVLNADYQWPGCTSGEICSQGLTVSNGSDPASYTNITHLCSDARVRRVIGFSQDGRVSVDWWYRFVSDSQARAWCRSIPGSGGGLEDFRYNVVGGGPQFTFDGAFHWDCQYGQDPDTHNCYSDPDGGGDVGINGEHFAEGDWWNRPQSAVGYSTDGKVLALAESNNRAHTMQETHDIMYQRLSAYGKSLKNAFKFDGGSKAGFWYYISSYSSTPDVTVPNVIRVQRTNSTCYSLQTNVNPGGAGNITINTHSNCAQGKYLPGTSVQLIANANSGYTFANWSGDASGSSNPTTITMNSNKNVTADFAASCPPTITGWKGEYWNNVDLLGDPALCRDDESLDFDWQDQSPHPVIQADQFSARWTRDVDFDGGFYEFTVFHDDGFRLYIDGSAVFSDWCNDCRETDRVVWQVDEGVHEVKLEMADYQGWAAARLDWEPLPDLTLESITYSPPQPIAGHPVEFTIAVKNQGPPPLPHGVRVTSYINNPPIGCSDPGDWWGMTDALGAGETEVLTYTRAFAEPGTYNVYAFVDSDCYLEEGNRDNNQMGIALQVSADNPPTAPSNLEATPVSAWQIDLTWTDNADNENGFKIERSLDQVSWTEIDTLSADATSYSDTDLRPDTTHYYRIYAFNAAGDSATSNVATATTHQYETRLVADINEDGRVNLLDYGLLRENFDPDKCSLPPGTVPGEIDLDGSVDIEDYNILADSYGMQVGELPAGADMDSSGQLTIPDPPSDVSFSSEINTFRTHAVVRVSWMDNSDNAEGFELSWAVEDYGSATYIDYNQDPPLPPDGSEVLPVEDGMTSSTLLQLPCTAAGTTATITATVTAFNADGVSSAAEGSSSIAVPRCAAPGDGNGDGRCTANDFAIWAYYFKPFDPVIGGPSVGDFNCDCFVNGNDFAIWAYYFTPY